MAFTTNAAADSASRQLRVRFFTKLEASLRVPKTSLAVPSNLTRMGLSEIVNLLLTNMNSEHKNLPFDFLVAGELVRMPLEDLLLAKGISAETVLEIEYIKAVVPQTQQDPCPHDDWVSAVNGSNPSFVVSGCYDGIARLWKDGAICTHILQGHSGPVTSVCIVPKHDVIDGSSFHLATGSKDRSVMLWKIHGGQHGKRSATVVAYKILQDHTSSVQGIAADPSGEMICSGSWDSTIKLWKVRNSEGEDDSVSIKKRKLVSNGENHEESQLEGEATSTLVGHSQCVSSVVWPQYENIYSASWDHSIRKWNIESGKESWSMVCGKALNCLDVGGDGSALVAAGGSDPVIRIWDPRKPGTLAPIFQLSSHTSWISTCKWHQKSWFHLLSASYDGKLMLWDLRTAWPLAVVDSHKDKVLCADWWKDHSVASGGADGKLNICSGLAI